MAYLYIICSEESSIHFANNLKAKFKARLIASDFNKAQYCHGIFLYEVESGELPHCREYLDASLLDYVYSDTILTVPKLAVFDMDSTLIPIEVIDELASYAGKKQQVAQVTELAMQGMLDFNQSLKQRVSCLEGLSESVIQELAEKLVFNPGVQEFCEYLISKKTQVAIASGGFVPFAQALKKRVPFSFINANQLEIIDSNLTGNVIGTIVNAKEKAKALNKWAETLSITSAECMAVGDGANDLLMLKEAGVGVAYHAKQKVNQSANSVLKYSSMAALIDLFEFAEEQIQI